MARIIDLKNRKFQPQEPIRRIQNEFIQPKPVIKPRENPPPPQATPGLKTQMFSWSGPLYIHRPDIKIIAVVSLTLFAIAALTQIFQKNIITTIFFGLLGVVILIRAGKKSGIMDFEINPLGVKVGERLYGFREIKSFWVEYDLTLDVKELSLQLRKWYYPYVKIPISDQNPVQLRLTLLAFLPEVEHKDTLADTLSRRLGL